MSLSFLQKKSWHTAKSSNVKEVWLKEEEAKKLKKKYAERDEVIKREKEAEELERSITGEIGGNKASLSFMYKEPEANKEDGGGGGGTHGGSKLDIEKSFVQSMDDSHVEYDDADDDAARAFKRMMAGVVEVENKIGFGEEEAGEKDVWEKSQVEEDLYKEANKNLSALEKATGKKRKITGSLASQVEMFPELKNAPVAKGLQHTSVSIKFNPLGKQFRQVKCMKCGAFGHQKGDRECKMGGWDPFNNTGASFAKAAAAPSEPPAKQRRVGEAEREEEGEDGGSSSDSSDSSTNKKKRKKKKKKKKEKEKKKKSKQKKEKKEKKRRKLEESAMKFIADNDNKT
ncbi:hypothetical protein TrCOL_g10378 [Triparma columacea]|uniref:CBF1-interacting co-repressor CIR N-terminal domain-containing protein n=1 Tax=Triparma columacea TaxID=722753 RepID=A0A9W7L340_9STRA|nr:hypothetical protein TrCOL_g10378 [Triparma columacea]